MRIINKDKNRIRVATIIGLAMLTEYRDRETGEHLDRIQLYTRLIAEGLGLKDKYIEDVSISSMLHDIGKVGIRDSVLKKKGKLNKIEFEIIKRHTIMGGDTLTAIEVQIGGEPFLTLGKEIAYHHHEKWDGTGYPDKLKGKQIPLSARIVAIADVYDALTTKRFYKEAFTHEKSREIIAGLKNIHFDPVVVEAFLNNEKDFQKIYINPAAEAKSSTTKKEKIDT